MNKSELPGAILEHPSRLFPLIWFDHLTHVLPSAMAPANNVTLLIASFQSASDTKAFEIAYASACGIAWHPYGMEHLLPVGDHLELTEPLAFFVNRVPRSPRFRTASAGSERLLQVADYASWSIQRWLERGDAEGIGPLSDKISSIRSVRITANEAGHVGAPWLRSDRLLHESIGDWVTWFQYDRGPTGSLQADRAIEASVRANNPDEALRFFGRIRFEEHLESRRSELRDYLAHLLHTLPAEQHASIQLMLARLVATLVDTEHEPDRRTLEIAAGILIHGWQDPTDRRDHVEDSQAGQRLCERLARDASRPDPFVECAVGLACERGLAYTRTGDTQAARRAYAEVLQKTQGVATPPRLQALAARAQVNLLGLLPPTPYGQHMLERLVERLEESDASLFTEPFCIASLNLAAYRRHEDRRDEEKELLSRALRRARGVAEPWVDLYVRRVEEICGHS